MGDAANAAIEWKEVRKRLVQERSMWETCVIKKYVNFVRRIVGDVQSGTNY